MSATLKQLEALYWVVKLGSLQAAATRLHTTQSAISKRVGELDTVFGGGLFERSGRHVVPTAKGRRIHASAQEMLALHEKMVLGLPEPESIQGAIRIGATELIAVTWLGRFLTRVKQEYPMVLLEILVDHGGNLLGKLTNGELDIALTPGPMWGRIFETVPLKVLDRCWMASPSLKIPRKVLTVDELCNFPIISLDHDTVHAQLQRAWFQRNGHYIRDSIASRSTVAVGNLVLAGLGVGLLPVGYYEPALKDGRLVRVRTTPALPNVKYFAVYRRGPMHRLAPHLGKLAREECNFERPSEHSLV
jgi:DNA-binding transcriptional LysR family regulator